MRLRSIRLSHLDGGGVGDGALISSVQFIPLGGVRFQAEASLSILGMSAHTHEPARNVVGSHQLGTWGETSVYAQRAFMQATGMAHSNTAGADVKLTSEIPESVAGRECRVLTSQTGMGRFDFGVPIHLTYDTMVAKSYSEAVLWMDQFGLHGSLDANGGAIRTVMSAPGSWSHLTARDLYASAAALDVLGPPTHASKTTHFTVAL